MNLFANKNFLLIYSINLLGTISGLIYTFIIPLILYDLTNSAFAMSTMRMMEFLPNVLLGMLAGVLVDRVNRNFMLVYGGLLKFLLSIVLLIAISTEEVVLWHLYILGFLLATIGYTVGNASNAIIPQLFEKSQMTAIQAKFSLVNTLGSIIGPALTGALLIWLSYNHFLWIYVICMGMCWLLATKIERTDIPVQPTKLSIWGDMKEGIYALIENKTLLTPTVTILISNFASSLCIGVQAFYVLDVLGNTEEQLGMMYTISAIGGIFVAKTILPLRKKFRRGQIYSQLPIIDLLVFLILFTLDSWVLIGLLFAIRTYTSVVTNIIYSAIRQETTPNHLLGRVAGTSSMLMKLAVPIGLLVGGLWAEVWPIPYVFLFCAIITLVNYIVLKRAMFSEVD